MKYLHKAKLIFNYVRIRKRLKKLKIKKSTDTLREILVGEKSISRFGDGEFNWILMRKQNSFQNNSEELKNRLIEVLQSNDENFMIGLPEQLSSLKGEKLKSKSFWMQMIGSFGVNIIPFLNNKKQYYSAIISRIYIGIKDKSKSKELVDIWKSIFNQRKILLIEGDQTRFGYGNDLLNNSIDIKRIECPHENAFDKYNEIFNKSKSFLKDNDDYLVVISLGPTATVLAYDLFRSGYQSIDIGHLDVEYEWLKLGTTEKVRLKNKYVNEVSNGDRGIDEVTDESYRKQILYRIK